MKKTIMLDASALKLSSCCLALDYTLIQGYRAAVNSSDIEWGSAFHIGKKVFAETGDETLAIGRAIKYYRNTPMYVKPKKLWLNESLLMDTIEKHNAYYAQDEWKVLKDSEGKPLVELRFAYPYRSYDDIDILLCGTIDEVCRNTIHGAYAIKDYKTSSTWNQEEELQSYTLSCQLMFYRFALESYARVFPDSIVGKAAGVNGDTLHAFIDGIFLSASKGATFKRSIPFLYPRRQMEEFQKGLDKAIEELVGYVRRPETLFRQGMMNGSCKKLYGMCQYFKVCSENMDSMRQVILQEDFVVKQYDPRTHGEEK